MSMYGSTQIDSADEAKKIDSLVEMYLADDILRGTKEQIKEFCESEEAQILVEKKVLNKSTIHRLSKADDLNRRITLAAYEMARDAKDPLYDKMVKFYKLKKAMSAKIVKKYGSKAKKRAIAAQKEYIKKAKSLKATKSEIQAQNAK